MKTNVKYPLYRKYSHGKAFFKIISSEEFEEIQVLGDKITLHEFKAKILPDRNYIADLTFDYHNHWDVINADEYEALRKKSKQ